MDWTNKSVFVTGAGGFIGSHIVSLLLEKGARVTAMLRYTSMKNTGNLSYFADINNANLTMVFGDVTDQRFLEHHMQDHDIVIHLAALIGIPYSYIAPISYVNTNIIGTVNVLETLKKLDVEIALFTSTSEVYGSALYTPIDEKHPLQGQSPYSASKIGADKLVESYHLSFGLPVSIVRPFNTFGPGQSTRAVIPTIIAQLLAGKDTIKLGDLTPTRDYVYVKDTARGFLKLAENSLLGKPVNLATGTSYSIGEIAQNIINMINPEAKIISDERRIRPSGSEVRVLNGDPEIAGSLGWLPKYTFDEGLKETINWFKAHMDKYDMFVDKYEQ